MIKILKYVTILNFSMNFILLKKFFPNKVIESGLNTKKVIIKELSSTQQQLFKKLT